MEYGWGETCFSGVTEPQTGKALDQAAKLGYRRIVVLPYFLFTGALVERVRAAADEAATRYPSIEFVTASYLNDHPLIVEAFSERIISALEGAQQGHRHHDHDHDHDHDQCEEDWHAHVPAGSPDQSDVYSLAPRKRAGGR
jgi:hypothetical protein